MNDTLKAAGRIGAELGAAKAENEKLRGLLEAALYYVPSNKNELRTLINAALPQQAEPTDTFTAVDMATAAAQGLRDGQAAVEQAAAQDERDAFREFHLKEFGCEPQIDDSSAEFRLTHANRWKVWLARATRPAQTEQHPAFPVDSEAWLQEWARGKFTYTGAYKPRVLGQLYGNTDWALARALHSAIVSQLHAPIAQTAPQPEQSGLVEALEEIASGLQAEFAWEVAEQALAAYRAALSAQGAGDADS